MNADRPRNRHSSPATAQRARGAGNLLTVIVVILVAAVGVLLVVNPSPKSALNTASDRGTPSSPSDQSGDQSPPPDQQPIPADTPREAQNPPEPPAEFPASPPLELDRTEVDFGYVLVGETLVEEVVLYNASDVPLNVDAIHTACPCTEAEVSPRSIAPRSSSVLTLTYTAQSYPHVPPARSVRIQLREYPREMIAVTMRAAVGREIRLNSDRSPSINEMSGEVRVESYDGEPFRVLMVDGSEPSFVDFDPETDEPRSSYLVRYDFTSRPGGIAPRHLHIVTDREGDSLAEIPTRFPPNFREPLNSDPLSWFAESRIIQVGTLSEAEPTSRQTILLKRTRTEGDLQLEATLHPATGDSTIGPADSRGPDAAPAVGVRIIEIEAGTKARGDFYVTLEFTLDPEAPPGLHHDILTLITPDESYTELDVVTHVVSRP